MGPSSAMFQPTTMATPSPPILPARSTAEQRTLRPVQKPGKIVCVGQNYRAHAKGMGGEELAEPILFGKFAVTAIANGEPIVIPRETTHVDAEAELAVVIGKQ